MTAEEEWRSVEGYPDYRISSHGRVLSCRRGAPRLLAGHTVGSVYRAVTLSNDDRQGVTHYVHHLVAAAFLGPRPEGKPQIRHLDGDPQNCAVDNLAHGTASENAHDRVRHGTHAMSQRTHCPQDHLYDEANTRMYRGSRFCRACSRNESRMRAQRRRAAQAAAPARESVA